jgi:hypothetical protein
MRRSLKLRFAALVSLLLIVPLCLSAAETKQKPPAQFCSLNFVVLRESDGKPIKNASVVIHSLDKNGNQERDGFQLKTDADGKTFIDDLPYGRMRVQAIAPHLQTYGEDIDVNQPKQELVIRLKPPAPQLSIYK